MVNPIRFVREICSHLPRMGHIIGDYIYFPLSNGNRIKAYCEKDMGVKLEVIHIKNGLVDSVYLMFCNYFRPVRCTEGAPAFYPRIDGDKWYFENTYSHVVPGTADFRNLANAIDLYISMWEEEVA